MRPSFRATASIPLFGFGKSVNLSSDQVRPLSFESAMPILPRAVVVRTNMRNRPSGSGTIAGWIELWTLARVNDRSVPGPGFGIIHAAFHPRRPRFIAFYRCSTDDGAVGQKQRLVFNRSKDSGGKMLDRRPSPAIIFAGNPASAPVRRVLTEFVVHPESTVLRVEENRVVCRDIRLPDHLEWRAPLAILETRSPDRYVGLALRLCRRTTRQGTAPASFRRWSTRGTTERGRSRRYSRTLAQRTMCRPAPSNTASFRSIPI